LRKNGNECPNHGIIEGTVGGPPCFEVSVVNEDARRYAARISRNGAAKAEIESIAER